MDTILRATIVYWVLLIVLRVIGRRSFEQMTPFEMILILLLGGIGIQGAMGDDRSLTGALLGIATIALLHVGVAIGKLRWEAFRRVVDGTPIVIIENGEWHRDWIHKLLLHEQDIMAAARAHGLERL